MQDKQTELQPYNEKGERHGLWVLHWGDYALCSKTNYVNGERCGFREAKARWGKKIHKTYYAK